MKKYTRRLIMVGMGLLLAICSAAGTYSMAVQSPITGNNASASLFLQTTSTPQPDDPSEIGSTDGIVAMGGVIALIVVIPIVLRRKYWMRQSTQ
jgi:hypothetical protein